MNQGCIETGATQPRVRRTGSQAKLAWLSDTCVDGSWMLQVAPRHSVAPFSINGKLRTKLSLPTELLLRTFTRDTRFYAVRDRVTEIRKNCFECQVNMLCVMNLFVDDGRVITTQIINDTIHIQFSFMFMFTYHALTK